jgi:hypothetical protein
MASAASRIRDGPCIEGIGGGLSPKPGAHGTIYQDEHDCGASPCTLPPQLLGPAGRLGKRVHIIQSAPHARAATTSTSSTARRKAFKPTAI